MAYREEGTITLSLLAKDLASGKVGAFVGHLDALAKKGGLVGSIAQGVGQSFGQMLNPIGALSSGVGMLTDFLGASVKAAAEEEAGIKRLTTAVAENDEAWDGSLDTVEDVIAAREKLAFSDGEQRDSLARLVAITKDVNKALALQATAMDFARLRGIDLATSSDIVGKVYGGNVGILSRYGVQLRRGAKSAEALAAVQKMAAGQAETYAETTQGAMESLQIAMEDVQEDIGKELLPVLKDLAVFARDDLVPAIAGVVEQLKNAKDLGVIDALLSIFSVPFDATGPVRWGMQIGANLVKGSKQGMDLYKREVLNSLRSADDEVADELQAHITAIVQVWNSLPSQVTGATLDRVKEAFIGGIDPTDRIELLGRRIPASLRSALAPAAPTARRMGRRIGESFGKGLEDATDEVRAASRALKFALEHPFDGEAEVQRIRGQLLGRRLARGIKESRNDPRVRDAVQDYITAQRKRLDRLKAEGYDVGYETSLAISAGIEANPWVRRFRRNAKRDKGVGGLSLYDLIENRDPVGRKDRPRSHRGGLDYVPYDGYPAILHQGEAVLTAQENKGGGRGSVHLHVHAVIADAASLQSGVRQLLPEIQRAMARQF